MRYIDIHTHVNIAAFAEDYVEVVERAAEAGVGMITVGTQHETSARAVEIAREFEHVWATVGLHPVHTSKSYHDEAELGEGGKAFTSRGEAFDYDYYKKLAEDPRVVAIGECGLDYFRVPEDDAKKKQLETFEAQIALANEVGKPLMLHIRTGEGGNAYKDAVDILKKQARVRGNSHFFAGSLEDAKAFWEIGYSTSFTGVLTFTGDYDEVVKAAPKELIHAETDAPYVAPKPYRGQRNEPAHVVHVVERMAELCGVSEEEMREQLMENAKGMFLKKKKAVA